MALTLKGKKTRLQWVKQKQLRSVDDWIKVIFSDQ